MCPNYCLSGVTKLLEDINIAFSSKNRMVNSAKKAVKWMVGIGECNQLHVNFWEG